ncbi:MAG: hypothetical protein KDC46_16535, partial [Thermoleophilia bacterium]|nr:hypothetical protein [Thermoleophilia bacterium]
MSMDETTEFDEAARAVAAAYADGDPETAHLLYERFHVKYLRPDMERWLGYFTRGYEENLDDDVYGRVLWRVTKSFTAGNPITKRELPTIYKRAAFDIHIRQEERQKRGWDLASERRVGSDPDSDVVLLEEILASAADTADEAIGEVSLARVRDRVHAHFIEAFPRRKKWPAVWLALCSGDTESASIAEKLADGTTRARVSQVKDEISGYLLGAGRHLIVEL